MNTPDKDPGQLDPENLSCRTCRYKTGSAWTESPEETWENRDCYLQLAWGINVFRVFMNRSESSMYSVCPFYEPESEYPDDMVSQESLGRYRCKKHILLDIFLWYSVPVLLSTVFSLLVTGL